MKTDEVAAFVEENKVIRGKCGSETAVTVQKSWPIGFELTARWENGKQRKYLISLARDFSDYAKWDSNKVTFQIANLESAAMAFVKAAMVVEAESYQVEVGKYAHLF